MPITKGVNIRVMITCGIKTLLILSDRPVTVLSRGRVSQVRPTAMTVAKRVIITDSLRNCTMISLRWAPDVLRIPISLARRAERDTADVDGRALYGLEDIRQFIQC